MRLFVCTSALLVSIAHAASAAPDDDLTREVRLETVLRLALARNLTLAESGDRARAADLRARAASRLPDPEVKYEQWGAPFARPFSIRQYDMVMVGVRQAFPAWGTRDARGRVAAEDAGVATEDARARRQALEAEVRRAYADYARTDHELRLHREHVALTARVVELARLNYQAGRGTQQDVLRLGLELSRLHADIARIEQEHRSSRARLNALMNRPPASPLGATPPPAPPETLPDPATLARGLEGRRPDLATGARTVRRSEAEVDLARRAARFPSVMVGLDYMYMPLAHEMRHGYGAMVSMSLPWLSGGRRDELAAAEQTLRADRRALDAARLDAALDVEEAAAALEAARAAFAVIDRDLLPQAQRALDATQAAFSVGQGDAVGLLDSLRSFLQVRVERVRAIGRIWSSLGDLQRAAGTDGGAR